jgi:hypothetical protein
VPKSKHAALEAAITIVNANGARRFMIPLRACVLWPSIIIGLWQF